jgi:TPR repeat protein
MSGQRPSGGILGHLVAGSGDSLGFAGRCAVEGAVFGRRLEAWRFGKQRRRRITGAASQLAEGIGVPTNYAAAAAFYRKAAEAGHAAAQYDLAYLYENGFGVAQDSKQRCSGTRKSAEQGDAEAQWTRCTPKVRCPK